MDEQTSPASPLAISLPAPLADPARQTACILRLIARSYVVVPWYLTGAPEPETWRPPGSLSPPALSLPTSPHRIMVTRCPSNSLPCSPPVRPSINERGRGKTSSEDGLCQTHLIQAFGLISPQWFPAVTPITPTRRRTPNAGDCKPRNSHTCLATWVECMQAAATTRLVDVETSETGCTLPCRIAEHLGPQRCSVVDDDDPDGAAYRTPSTPTHPQPTPTQATKRAPVRHDITLPRKHTSACDTLRACLETSISGRFWRSIPPREPPLVGPVRDTIPLVRGGQVESSDRRGKRESYDKGKLAKAVCSNPPSEVDRPHGCFGACSLESSLRACHPGTIDRRVVVLAPRRFCEM